VSPDDESSGVVISGLIGHSEPLETPAHPAKKKKKRIIASGNRKQQKGFN
jgi:hypothetical protein